MIVPKADPSLFVAMATKVNLEAPIAASEFIFISPSCAGHHFVCTVAKGGPWLVSTALFFVEDKNSLRDT